MAQEVIRAVYDALRTFVEWVWGWIASAISWFISAVAQYIYNLFISFVNTLSAVVNAVAGWLWGAVKTMVIAPAQSALTNAVAFIQRKLFGTIYIAALVKLYEIEIKSFVEKPSLKKVLLMVAKPLLLYIGLTIMFGTLQSMGLMPAVQPQPLIAPSAPTPTPVAGVPTLPSAPTGIEVKEAVRFSGAAKGAAALVQTLADAVRFSGTAAGVAPQVLPVPSDAVRTSLAATYSTTVRPTFAQDVVRASLYAGAARPITTAPRDVLRSALAAMGVVLPTVRPSDTVYSSLRTSWAVLPTTKVGDVVRPMYGVEWERVTLASAKDMVRSSLSCTATAYTADPSGIDPDAYAPPTGWTKVTHFASPSDLDDYDVDTWGEPVYEVANGMLTLLQSTAQDAQLILYFNDRTAQRIAVAFRIRDVQHDVGLGLLYIMSLISTMYDEASNTLYYYAAWVQWRKANLDGTLDIYINMVTVQINEGAWYVIVLDRATGRVYLYDAQGNIVYPTPIGASWGFGNMRMPNRVTLYTTVTKFKVDVDWIAYSC